jgi:hypothetical protein
MTFNICEAFIVLLLLFSNADKTAKKETVLLTHKNFKQWQN